MTIHWGISYTKRNLHFGIDGHFGFCINTIYLPNEHISDIILHIILFLFANSDIDDINFSC